MRQVMPHRNNIELRRTKSKRYFSGSIDKRFRPPAFGEPSAPLQARGGCAREMKFDRENNHLYDYFGQSAFAETGRRCMGDMQISQETGQ
jgi:hypothetical protein